MQKSLNYGLALANASEVGDWIAERWPEHRELPSEQRLAMACFSIARAHHRGILVLLEADARTAATALVRPLFEATIKGQWFRHCANPQRLSQADQRVLDGSEGMAQELAKKHNDELLKIKSKHVTDRQTIWNVLCDYAHGGKLQIFSWFKGVSINESHTDLTIMRLLELVNLIAILAARGAAEIAGQTQDVYAEKIRELAEDAWLITASAELAEMDAEIEEQFAELSDLYDELIGRS